VVVGDDWLAIVGGEVALSRRQRAIKRAFDLVVTLVALAICLPLMGLIALRIWREGTGPIFFRQQRVGQGGRLFTMIKFRTMVPEAEQLQSLVTWQDEDGALIHKRVDDPRVTPYGRLLRRTSLDELPQLLNVWRGEMSLVGPRPELPWLVAQYAPWQYRRLTVPQGITGYWQVNRRSERPMHLATEADIHYVDHYSLGLDLAILLKTPLAVLRGDGAY
jgi:lipopolysaccharide/colanic/teichoic acid biosynthesis glycosyltransferase